ncbi:MAG: rhomboid family intramembrane serine protease, partial [Kofleriaceae bacterium]
QPWVLYGLIAANVVMFGVELVSGADLLSPSPKSMLALGASFAPLTLQGEPWRLGSSMFLHFGLVHLALNMLCLYQARAVEGLFGHVGFLVIYLLAGLGGGIASLLAHSTNVVSAGASGAVFGVYGAFGAKLVMHRAQIDPEAWQSTVRSLGSFLLLNAIIGLSMAGISVSAHFGGLVVGAGLGAALLAGDGPARRRRPLLLLGLGLALTAGAVTVMHPAVSPTSAAVKHFNEVEHASTVRWNAGLARLRSQELAGPALADVLEREAITPYRDMSQELLAVTDIPPRLGPLFHTLHDYITARLSAWGQFVAELRETDHDKKDAMLEDYKLREQAATAARAAYNDALHALK